MAEVAYYENEDDYDLKNNQVMPHNSIKKLSMNDYDFEGWGMSQ